jgi:hypothetical protein
MTGQERDYEAELSRVLHTTMDQFEPVGDGLTKIRERLSEPWLKRQWWLLRSEFTALRWLVVVRCESFVGTLRSRSAAADSALADSVPDPLAPLIACSTPDTPKHAARLRSLPSVVSATVAWVTSRGPGRGSQDEQSSQHGPVLNWLRPALAVAGAVVLVVAGVFALGSIRTVVGLDGATGTSHSSTGGQPGNGNANGGGTQFSSGASSQRNSQAPSSGASAGHNKAATSSTPCPPASPPAQNSPPPSSPPPSSPPPSSPPPSSPPPSSPPPTSQAPIISGIAGHTTEPIGTTALVTCARTPGPQPSPTSSPA